MTVSKISEIDMLMADGFPGGIAFPQNVVCPNHCKFCYEDNLKALFPWIITKYIPAFDSVSFNSYIKNASLILRNKQVNIHQRPTSHIILKDGKFYYFPKCDFFALGLKPQQIEIILKYGRSILAYTTGYNADPDLIEYFTKRYPRKFHLSFSLITFDPIIRKHLMNPIIQISGLKKICRIIKGSVYYLLYFNQSQISSDVRFLNEFSLKNNNLIYISKLFYSDLSPEVVKLYGKKANNEGKPLLNCLKKKEIGDFTNRFKLYFDPIILAWTKNRQIRSLVRACHDRKDTVIFCTRGAYPIIRNSVLRAHVIVPKSCFGGNIDFALSLTSKQIILEIRKLISRNIALTHIYMPDNMFYISKKYDLNLDTIDTIKQSFPGFKIELIKIPLSLLKFEVTPADYLKYYSSRHNTKMLKNI